MSVYTVELPDERERGIRVECDEHGESEEFEPGYRTVAFYCELCGYEVEINVHDTHEWRDFGERC
ncbi:hypothetical protein CV102_14010 [Natronococcus pandeyae]|uniref:Uncharacterized protein n=1 Tax=Natronococcus pandeyae TaxID=2055836 RepID=A0A8J8Q3W2_9EURY|nr:hypothetical protein [Natronococcus pandeyae]TYL38013.1 hypothetical protein CV102_14010 [Natronococcus pandeyae]